MTNKLQVFNFNSTEVRVIEKDGQPWWIAKDVCDVLEHTNPTEALRGLDDDEKNTLRISEGIQGRGNPNMAVINESGLYALIVRSNKPEAKKFRKWITSEVLPALRKTGSYSITGKAAKEDAAVKRADAMLNNSRVRLAKFVRETVKDIWEYLSPEAKQSYSSYVVETATGQPGLIPLPVVEKSYTASEIGAEFGISANMVGRLANSHGLKTTEYGFEVLDKARGHDKQIPSFRYNENGRAAIARIVQKAGNA